GPRRHLIKLSPINPRYSMGFGGNGAVTFGGGGGGNGSNLVWCVRGGQGVDVQQRIALLSQNILFTLAARPDVAGRALGLSLYGRSVSVLVVPPLASGAYALCI